MMPQSHEISIKKDWAITQQATLLKSGLGQWPQNDPIDVNLGVLWGIWLTLYGGWGVELKEHSKWEEWEPGATRISVL